MNQEIYDARLQHYLRKVIAELPYEKRRQLKSLASCNKNLITNQIGYQPAAFLLRSESGRTKLFGQMTCKNTWACPHCTAMMMQKYKRKIGAALDAMRKRNYFAFMISFAIPHIRPQSCREVTDVLYKTWHGSVAYFTVKHRKRVYNAWHAFAQATELKDFVRVAEYTWSLQNGWHPHFHVIFWIPKKFKDKILEFEDSLRDCWIRAYQREYEKYWKEKDITPRDFCLNAPDRKQSMIISKDDNGEVREVLSSEYITGWGGDSELTGNYRKQASHENHYTPYQLLEKAANGDKQAKYNYIDFMLEVTRKPVHHRVNFSRKGNYVSKIAVEHMNSEGYKEIIAKKKEKWEVVCWFTQEQWQHLCELDLYSPFISNIMLLASLNRKDLLIDFLRSFDIELVKSAHLRTKVVEEMYNAA